MYSFIFYCFPLNIIMMISNIKAHLPILFSIPYIIIIIIQHSYNYNNI